jgi:adenylate kinase family enzyme
MKILIIGIVAAGKTTLARKLSETLNISWYEGDCIKYREDENGRNKRTPQEQLDLIIKINTQESWIIEGTPRKSQEILFDLSDRIIFLDPPLIARYCRILIRYIKQKLGIEKCHYKASIHMLKMMFRWTNEFEQDRASFETRLNLYGNKVIRVKRSYDISTQLIQEFSNQAV